MAKTDLSREYGITGLSKTAAADLNAKYVLSQVTISHLEFC